MNFMDLVYYSCSHNGMGWIEKHILYYYAQKLISEIIADKLSGVNWNE